MSLLLSAITTFKSRLFTPLSNLRRSLFPFTFHLFLTGENRVTFYQPPNHADSSSFHHDNSSCYVMPPESQGTLVNLWYPFFVYVCVCSHYCHPKLSCHHLPPRSCDSWLVSLPQGCLHSSNPTHWNHKTPSNPLLLQTSSHSSSHTGQRPKSPSGIQTFSKCCPILSIWPHPRLSIHACLDGL